MGFFDLLGDIVQTLCKKDDEKPSATNLVPPSLGNIVQTLWEKGDEKLKKFDGDLREYKMKYEAYDTERLKKLYRSSYGAKKMAIASILKDREMDIID